MYIVFEGMVGSGKSTQSKKLVDFLTEKYEVWKVIHVREPGGTKIAEDIRHLCQAKLWEDEEMHPLTNAYLYAAARSQLLRTVVKPALEEWKIIISDRSFLSSLAYQWEAQWLWFDVILSVNKDAVEGVLPDYIFYMDIDIDTALSRTFDAVGDKWEKMWKVFFESISTGYDKCEKLELLKDRFIRIDANGTQEEIFENILKKIKF